MAIAFKRNVALVSVSMDGVELPKIYTYEDMKSYLADTKVKPSAIKTINGKDAPTFLENESMHSFQTGKDAGYNAMLRSAVMNYNAAKTASLGNFGGDTYFQFYYPGANTTLEYENGTTSLIETQAVVRTDFTNVKDGESLYQSIVVPELSPVSSTSNMSAPETTPTKPSSTPGGLLVMQGGVRPVGYPDPVVISSDMKVGGYYLDGAHKDTGVLVMLDFAPKDPKEFQATIQSFIADMKKDGKTKVIVDMSTNTGGLVNLAHDAFRQFFPNTTEESYSRFREHPAFNELVTASNSIVPAKYDIATSSSVALTSLAADHFNYHWNINQIRQPFTSKDAEFAPVTFNGDTFSSGLAQYDYANPLVALNKTTGGIGIEVTGYGTRTNFPQPFPAANIVLLYDGQCGSACSMFSLNMEQLGGVKSIAMGGRPNKDLMQGIGGTRGSLAFQYVNIYTRALEIFSDLPKGGGANMTNLKALSPLPILRSLDNELGVRDQMLPDHFEDGIPAQMLHLPTPCKLFYTPETVMDIPKMWTAVADSAFGGKACNAGAVKSAARVRRVEEPVVEHVPRRLLVRRAAEARSYLEDVRRDTVVNRREAGSSKVDGRKGLPDDLF